jgi:tetratricopeptide (TPR) repeat protein
VSHAEPQIHQPTKQAPLTLGVMVCFLSAHMAAPLFSFSPSASGVYISLGPRGSGKSVRVVGMRPATFRALLAAFACVAFACSPTLAQDTSWEATTNAARSAESAGRLAEAEALYLTAVHKTQALGDDARLATSLENLGMFYFARRKPAEAVPLLLRALDTRLRSEGPDSSNLKRVRANLAGVLQAQGKDHEAEKLYLDAVEEARKSGKEDLRLADSLEELGGFHAGRREFADAEPLFKQALGIKTRILPPDDPGLAEPLSRLAQLYRDASKLSQAEPLMLRELDIEEKVLGAESVSFAQQLYFLADLYQQEGKWPEAETVLKRTLAIDTKLDGPNSPSVAVQLGALAKLAREQQNYAEAEQLDQQVLAIQEKAGPDNPGVLSTLSDLAEIYGLEENYGAAEATYERVLAIQMSSSGLPNAIPLGTVGRLGALLEHEGKFQEAEVVYRNAVEWTRAAPPGNRLLLIASLNTLALFYERHDSLVEAETYYELALKEFGGTQPSGDNLMDWNLAIIMKNYARLLRKMNRPGEAVRYEAGAQTIGQRLDPKPLRK